MEKLLIISSSPVKNSNSLLLCQAFGKGAEEAGYQVEIIHLREKYIPFCLGCEACVKTGKGCVQKDDMAELILKMHQADVFVLATPIYFMTVSAQLKVFIDRCIAGEQAMRQSEGKKAYFISVCAAPEAKAEENHAAANGAFRGFLQCLRTVEEGGILNASGCYAPGSIAATEWPTKAYELGRSLSPSPLAEGLAK